MRTISSGLLAFALCGFAAVPVIAQPPPPPPPGRGNIPPGRMRVSDAPGRVQIMVPFVPPSLDLDKESAGLARSSRPELLTWGRVYALALVRSRDARGGFAEALDPKGLDEQAARGGAAEFDRFRKEFLAAGRSFRDPSGDYLDLLRRLQTIDNARRNVAVHENLSKFIGELIQGEAAGLTQLDVDLVFASLLRTRQGLSDEIGQFRNRLDEVKVALGLSPHALVIPDRRSLLAFGTAFDAVESWSRQPDRTLNVLHQLAQKLPALGDVVVDGHPILGTLVIHRDVIQHMEVEVVVDGHPILSTVEETLGPGEDVFAKAIRLAIENRNGPDKRQVAGDANVQLELRVRRRIRHLFQVRHAYEMEKLSYERAMRLKDQAFERMVGPSTGGVLGRSPLVDALLGHVAEIQKAEDRLVTLWTSFRTERLAFYRELGVLPYTDWASFYKDLSSE